MALDPIWVIESAGGAAIGHCTPIEALTVVYQGIEADVDTVNASSLELDDGRVVNSGSHPGTWPKVLKSNLDSVRDDNWPTETGDVEVQGSDAVSFGAQTLSRITYARPDDTPETV